MDQSTRVIIINYNAGEALLRCVASVLANRLPLTAVVADNQSTDQSCEILRSRYGSAPRLEILENPVNLGFGPAVNACARAAKEDYLLILNPDCELETDTLQKLIEALQQDSNAALAAPCVVDHAGQVMRGTWRTLPDPWKAWLSASGLWRLGKWIPAFQGVELPRQHLPQVTTRAEAVSGACMLVRTGVFKGLGGFDEGFRMHFEDLDLMARIRNSGQHCLYVPQASAIHPAGVSSATRPAWVYRQKHLGMQRYFRKHYFPEHGPVINVLVSTATWLHYLLGWPLMQIRRLANRGKR